MTYMYGDLVNGLCYTAFIPVYLKMWLIDDPSNVGAKNINYAFMWTCFFNWLSYLKSSSIACILGCLGMNLSIMGMNLYKWPHNDEAVVVPQFFWSLVIISGNLRLNYFCKIGLGIVAFINATVISYYSPLVEMFDELPALLATIAIYIAFHYYSNSINQTKGVCAQGAIIVLMGTFVYYTSLELIQLYKQEGSAKEHGYTILKAGFLTGVGLAAAGAFRDEIDINDILEELVRQRSEKLRIVEHALQASDTAFAITDSKEQIIWFNKALETITGITSEKLQNGSITDVLYPKSKEDENSAEKKKSHLNQKEFDIMLQKRHIRVEITRLPQHVHMTTADIKSNEDSCNKSQPSFGIFSSNRQNSKDASMEQMHDKKPKEDHMHMIVLKDTTAQHMADEAQLEAEKAAAASATKTEMMQTLSHELRTPLQGIMGVSSTILADLGPENGAIYDSLSTILASSRLLLTLINNVLDLRKLQCNEEEEKGNELLQVNLEACMNESVGFCKPFATLNEVSLRVDLNSHYANNVSNSICNTVMANPLRLQQVMVNLISNSIKYTDCGTQVKISVRESRLHQVRREVSRACSSDLNHLTPQELEEFNELQDSDVMVISVRDHGKGIPSSEYNKLFGEFMQLEISAHKDKQKYENIVNKGHSTSKVSATSMCQSSGSGLGLNLAMKFVRKMNGHIWVNNCEGGGASFNFFLYCGTDRVQRDTTGPLHAQNNQSVRASSQQVLMAGSNVGSPRSSLGGTLRRTTSSGELFHEFASQLHILIVDDSRINLKVFSNMLNKLGVGHTECALSGEKALQYINKYSNRNGSHNTGLYHCNKGHEDHSENSSSSVSPKDSAPHIIITDLQMPGMDGFGLKAELNKVDWGVTSQRGVPPIMMACTADWTTETEKQCIDEYKFDGILHKPITIPDLKVFLTTPLCSQVLQCKR